MKIPSSSVAAVITGTELLYEDWSFDTSRRWCVFVRIICHHSLVGNHTFIKLSLNVIKAHALSEIYQSGLVALYSAYIYLFIF